MIYSHEGFSRPSCRVVIGRGTVVEVIPRGGVMWLLALVFWLLMFNGSAMLNEMIPT